MLNSYVLANLLVQLNIAVNLLSANAFGMYGPDQFKPNTKEPEQLFDTEYNNDEQMVFNTKNRKLVGLEKLLYEIFQAKTYNKFVRPTNNITGLTHVQTQLKLLQIDLDEKYQELISTVWIEMIWTDKRFEWDPSLYDGVSEITVPNNKLWLPDIVLQNGVGKNSYLTEFKYFNPWVNYKGIITWVPEVKLYTSCIIKISDFPFDTQCCQINFYSWAHTAKQMKITQYGNINVTNTTHFSYNAEFEIYDTCAAEKVIETSEDLYWWVTSYTIYVERQSTYHIYTIVLPCIVLSMLSILLFMLPPDSGEKIGLGVTILLAFFVNSLVISNYTPEGASDLPVIGVYFLFNIGQVSLSLFATIFVLKCHFRGHKSNPAPRWLKLMFFMNIENDSIKLQNENDRKFQKDNLVINALIPKGKELIKINESNYHMKNSTSNDRSPVIKNDSVNEINQKLLKTTKYILKKQERIDLKQKEINLVYDEWKEIARRVDFLMFLIFLFVVVATPIFLFGKLSVMNNRPADTKGCQCTKNI